MYHDSGEDLTELYGPVLYGTSLYFIVACCLYIYSMRGNTWGLAYFSGYCRMIDLVAGRTSRGKEERGWVVYSALLCMVYSRFGWC